MQENNYQLPCHLAWRCGKGWIGRYSFRHTTEIARREVDGKFVSVNLGLFDAFWLSNQMMM